MKLHLEFMNGKWWQTIEGYSTRQIEEEKATKLLNSNEVDTQIEEEDYRYYLLTLYEN